MERACLDVGCWSEIRRLLGLLTKVVRLSFEGESSLSPSPSFPSSPFLLRHVSLSQGTSLIQRPYVMSTSHPTHGPLLRVTSSHRGHPPPKEDSTAEYSRAEDKIEGKMERKGGAPQCSLALRLVGRLAEVVC
jgi:hypothetical protein